MKKSSILAKSIGKLFSLSKLKPSEHSQLLRNCYITVLEKCHLISVAVTEQEPLWNRYGTVT